MDINIKNINENQSKICYFKTMVEKPYRKALVQITERCNLGCKHCFVSAKNSGSEMKKEIIEDRTIPVLKKLNVVKVTITGGEPFMHNDIIEIVNSFSKSNFSVGICTNATLIDNSMIEEFKKIKNIHFNISLDGFTVNSHETFRGKSDIFNKILDNIKVLGENRLLQGILVTPNKLADIQEYKELCLYAKNNHAKYVLFNPLSKLGRGLTGETLAMDDSDLIKIIEITKELADNNFEIAYIRFPNDKSKSHGSCCEGRIIYIFANGDLTNCPYVTFATKSSGLYDYKDFIATNIFDNEIDNELLENKSFKKLYNYSGCLSAIITSGQQINNAVDPLL